MPEFFCPLCGEVRALRLASIDMRAAAQRLADERGVELASELLDPLKLYECAACQLQSTWPVRAPAPSLVDAFRSEPAFADEALVRWIGRHAAKTGANTMLVFDAGDYTIAKALGPLGEVRVHPQAQRFADAYGLGVDAGGMRYDLVVASHVLGCTRSPAGVLDYCVDKLGPGAHFIAVVTDRDAAVVHDATPLSELPPYRVTRWSRAAVEAAGAMLGLRLSDLLVTPVRYDDYRALVAARGLAAPMVPGDGAGEGLAPLFFDLARLPGRSLAMLFAVPTQTGLHVPIHAAKLRALAGRSANDPAER